MVTHLLGKELLTIDFCFLGRCDLSDACRQTELDIYYMFYCVWCSIHTYQSLHSSKRNLINIDVDVCCWCQVDYNSDNKLLLSPASDPIFEFLTALDIRL